MDENTKAPVLPASLVNGRLEGISVPDLLWNLGRCRSTGVLSLTSRGITRKVYVEEGRLIFAASGNPNDRLGELLLREGAITLDQLEGAIAKLPSGKRLGALLVEAGHLAPDALVRGVLNQVRGIVLGLFDIEEGEYHFAEGGLPTEEVVTLGMRTADILLQGIRQIRSFSRIRKSVGSSQTRFRLEDGWRTLVEGLEIRDGERMLLKRIEEGGAHGTSIDRLCREVFLSNFEIYQALWAFKVLGVMREVERGFDASVGAEFEGSLDRTSLPEVLIRLCRDGETGVLHVSRGTVERTLHIREGVCVFATSNAIDDGLIAHLLKRGVISLRDREETARRLLSNKRVGTILLEMGVIDDSDLRLTVREQLSEIVFDTFRWDGGEFHFLSGELPTIEEITLDRSVEDLVFAGVRRVTSWSRVREGCGGLGARLVLLPDYLAVLDKMSIGAEEWELISLLKQPKTVLESCRESLLGDFRSCQILWALRLLGAVGEAPVEQSVDLALGALGNAGPAAEDAATEAEAEASAQADAGAEPVSEPEDGSETAAASSPVLPEPDPDPIALSSTVDEAAEIISEPWRLANERKPEDRPEATPAVLPGVDSPADATLAIPREEVEAALRADDAGALPRFELGEPGSGLEAMEVDIAAPAPSPEHDFEVGPPASGLEADVPEAHAARESDSRSEADAVPEPEPPAPAEPEASAPTVDDDALQGEVPAIGAGFAIPTAAAHEAPAADRTEERPRSGIETGQNEADAGTEAPDVDAFELPPELDGAIAAFNSRHVILFRALRMEVGAGAANFVRSCRVGLADGAGAIFEGTELQADGSWDPAGLKGAVLERRVADVASAFQGLLDQEMELLRVHLGAKRVAALEEQLQAVS